MRLKRITDFLSKDFEEAWEICQDSFPRDERRSLWNQKSLSDRTEYSFSAIIQEKEIIGFMDDWHLEGFSFMEHLALKKGWRNLGIGSKIIREYARKHKKVIFEAERPVIDLPSEWKMRLYKKLGFFENGYNYIQPPYEEDKKHVTLVLMSYPHPIVEYSKVLKEIHSKVYGFERPFSGIRREE